MNLFGLTISRSIAKANTPVYQNTGSGWWNIVRESFAGAWQQNVEVRTSTVLTYNAVFSCVSLIASDIGKLRPKLMQQNDTTKIWSEVEVPAFSPVLRKPNHYQNRIKFFEQWIISKLVFGNTYVLKARDNRNIITKLFILDPSRVTPLIAEDGSVWYELKPDLLAGLSENETITVPASEIIHDPAITLYHPLVGVSPIYACGLAATQGLRIQNNSAVFFGNRSNPGGVLIAPGAIDDATAGRLKTYWEANFTGTNSGKVAVLGDGLKYEAMHVNAVDSQLIEQLKWTAETVCSVFHVPPYMVGIGPAPAYNNIEALNQQYYTQCLQTLIENLELCLDEGLELPKDKRYGTEFDLDGLLRMDTATQYKSIAEGIGGGFLTPNEGRKKLDLDPLEGGDTVYLQQQNFSIEALAERDENKPFAKPTPATSPATPTPSSDSEEEASNDNEQASAFLITLMKGLR